MLSMRKIDTIRKYKFDLDMPIRTICYKLDVSPSSVYKYIKIDDFSEMLKKPRKKRPRKMEPYEPIIKEWLIEDKTRHYKQRHTAKRVYDRLSELYEDFNVSYPTVATTFRRLKSEVYYVSKEYAPLRHLPGEAQVDLGLCDFVEKGIKYRGYYLVMSFPYSNIAFCQLLKGKNAQCLIQAMKNIFEFIGGWLPTIPRKPNSLFHSSLTDMFTERLREFLLNGSSKIRGIYMKALCALVNSMPLSKAISIADVAVRLQLEEYDAILQIAAV